MRWVVPGVVALLLAIAGSALARYQPLAQVGDLEAGGEMQLVTVEEFEDAGAHIVRYVDGGYVSYVFTVRNTGPVAVKVRGLALPAERERRLLQPVRAGLADEPTADGELQPLEPFRLGSGEERRIVVQARFDNCEYYTERAIETMDRQVVMFSVAGVPRNATVTFTRPLLVRSPTIHRCANRTLDRSENRRDDQ